MPKKKITKEVKLDLFGFFLTEFGKNPKTDEMGLKIIGFRDIKKHSELDKEYMEFAPYFYLDDEENFVHLVYLDTEKQEKSVDLRIGDWVNFDDFSYYYRDVLEACYKLSNKKREYRKLFKIMFSCGGK